MFLITTMESFMGKNEVAIAVIEKELGERNQKNQNFF